MVTGQDDKK